MELVIWLVQGMMKGRFNAINSIECLADAPPGLYFIKVIQNNFNWIAKVVKQ